jgi:hypothetical protein
VHEVLREEAVNCRTQQRAMILAGVALASSFVGTRADAADEPQRLTGAQIRARFAGMQLTDEVHWREVYERDGTVRSYSMGTKKIGRWTVERDELCLYFKETDDGCYEVSRVGEHITVKPSGLGLSFDGVLQTPTDHN